MSSMKFPRLSGPMVFPKAGRQHTAAKPQKKMRFADLESCNEHIRRGLEDQISDALGPETHFPTSLVPRAVLGVLFLGAGFFHFLGGPGP